MNKTVTLIIGTNKEFRDNMSKGIYPELSWWSDNLETAAHYYDGCVMEITVELNGANMEYYRSIDDIIGRYYTYGSMQVKYPVGATWYSFSGRYLRRYVVMYREIWPDMSMYNEEESLI